MARLESLFLVLLLAGCATTDARWEAGVTLATDREGPATVASDVSIYMKQSFSPFELEAEKRPFACHSTTLLRRMGLLDRSFILWLPLDTGPSGPPPGPATVLGELTTEEYPRDEERSKILGHEFKRVFGVGGDELGLFSVVPSQRSIEKGLAKLREMAAAIGANEVRDVYYTGYAEHQMWEGTALSVTPTSTDSFFYADVLLLELRLRDVRFHGTAVIVTKYYTGRQP